MIYLTLYWEFFRIGLFAIGGGFAAIPFLFDLTNRHPWYTSEALVNMIAISEVAPGPIGIRMSTYAGFQVAGIPGSIVATLGLITPGIVSIFILVRFLRAFSSNPYINHFFYGLRPAVTALVAVAALDILRIAILDFSLLSNSPNIEAVSIISLILLVVLLAASRWIKWYSPLMMLGTAALVGVIFRL